MCRADGEERIWASEQSEKRNIRIERFLPRLYVISNGCGVGEDLFRGLLRTMGEILEGGVRMIQVREKGLSRGDLYKISKQLRDLTDRYKAKLIINRDLEVALGVGADGVQVGGGVIEFREFKNEVKKKGGGCKFLTIYSAHCIEEAEEVFLEGADAMTYSPIYETKKKYHYPGKGIKELEEVVRRVKIPVYGLGGIKESNLEETLRSGVYGVAMMSELTRGENLKGKAERIIDRLNEK